MKYSVVIPTYNHLDDLLIPCINSIVKYSSSEDMEIVVVANGCTDGTERFLNEAAALFPNFIVPIIRTEKLGYTRATNIGISAAKGEYVILLNNDTVLLDQSVDQWLDMLVAPFAQSKSVGITGPVKFDWDCGGRTLQAMAFWLVMIKREVFDKIGILDEVFSPGMGEDGDFCIRMTQAGYSMVSVPNDVAGHFDTGIVNTVFPIYHVGNGTFNDPTEEKELVIKRNMGILIDRYGSKRNIEVSIIVPTYNHLDDALRPCLDAILAYTDFSNKELIVVANGCTDDTRTHLETLMATPYLGLEAKGRVSQFLKYIWIDEPAGVIRAYNAGINLAQGRRIVTIDNDSILQQQPVDSWINTLLAPFNADPKVGASSPFANDYEGLDGVVLHSGCTMYDAALLRSIGGFDEVYNPGYFSDSDVSMQIWKAGRTCVEVPVAQPNKKYKDGVFEILFPVVHTGEVQTMNKHADIEILKKNRAILYARYTKSENQAPVETANSAQPPVDLQFQREATYPIPSPQQSPMTPIAEINRPKYSIVIPTYNHCDDLLKPCIDSILQYSDMSQVEIIVVANGCTDGTKDYLTALTQLTSNIHMIWSDEAIGYTKATNLGIQKATGQFTVLLNNDTVLLEQENNRWLDWLNEPFANPKVGITGPLELFDNYSNHAVLIFFCVMIRTSVFDQIGVLDEIYTPGGGEDIDFTIRLKNAGFLAVEITPKNYTPAAGTNVGGFPIWHKDNQTFKQIPSYTNYIVKRNGLHNCVKYNNDIRLNIGAGGIDYEGFLSVDKYDKRANVDMDITNLDKFGSNSVTEMMASHVFEHLNPYHAVSILQEWLRVLKPGGKLSMEMPDILALCKTYVKNAEAGIVDYGTLNAIYGSVNTTDTGGPDEITSPHLFGWEPRSMLAHMQQAGFTDITFHPERWPHPCDNFRVEAYKPAIAIDRNSLQHQEPHTFEEIFVTNSYGLETVDVRGKTVIDIGANLGMFSLACLERGATRIISVEAQPVIYQLGLTQNVKPYEAITAMNYAASDVDGATVHILNHHVGSKVGGDVGEEVETITLQQILYRNNVIGEDLVLKIDCEGSEFNVLLPSPPALLRRFSTIYMEVHANTNENPHYHDTRLITDKLTYSGFSLVKDFPFYTTKEDGQTLWIGVAVQKWVRNK